MPVPREDRETFFLEQARDLVSKYNIKKERRSDLIDAQRVGYLFTNVLIKIYTAAIGQDAYIFVRDWAHRTHICCDKLLDIETRGGREVKCPYSTSVKRIYEELSFHKYTNILEEMLAPKRRPLRGRTPVIH